MKIRSKKRRRKENVEGRGKANNRVGGVRKWVVVSGG